MPPVKVNQDVDLIHVLAKSRAVAKSGAGSKTETRKQIPLTN
jgi:hypothetical protein